MAKVQTGVVETVCVAVTGKAEAVDVKTDDVMVVAS